MKNQTEYFDTLETKIVYDIISLKTDIKNILIEIEQKQKLGIITPRSIYEYADQIKEAKVLIEGLVNIPFVKFYKQFNYFTLQHPLTKINNN